VPDRALSFGPVAAAYERFRPGYPEELVDEVLAYAGQVRSALEIGAGTGKATRIFAARGVAVTATDPDASMLAELRRHVPDTVGVVQASFEELPLTTTYDLVFAAAAFHWTEPDGRWRRVAAMLRPGGTFASFGGQHHLADVHLERAVGEVCAPYLDDDVPSPDGPPPGASMRWPGTELEQSGHFTDVRQSVIARRPLLTRDQYVGHLATISAYLQLAPPVRDAVLREIGDVLPDRVEVDSDVTLHLARRVG
jgi:SAM-dependent methyltransferase